MRRLGSSLLAVAVLAASPVVAQEAGGPVVQPVAAAAMPAGQPAVDPTTVYADALLAQRIAEQVQQSLHAHTPTPAAWRQAMALLSAANRLDPREPRYPQLMAEAALNAGDSESAVAGLKAYRVLMPGDQSAQVKLIDLYTGRFQVAEKRLAYLTSVLENPTVPAEVRSYAALSAARLYRERSQTKQTAAMLDQALRLNPLSPEALSEQFQATASTATPVERAALLMRMILANPAQPERAADLADELADAGLTRASLEWYAFAVRVWNRLQQAPPHRFIVTYASQFYLSERSDDADSLAKQLLTVDPTDVDAALLRLLANRSGPGDRYKALLDEAGAMLRGRVLGTRRTEATTQPAEPSKDPLPDLSEDIVRAQQPDNEGRKRALVATLSDLAWFQIYFANAPQDATKTLEALRKLADENSVSLARLEGWALLMQNRTQEATVKLSAVADRDPISAMGVARIQLGDEKTKVDGIAAARKVLADAPSGLLGAVVWDGLKDLNVKRGSVNGADLIVAQLDKFPRQWLTIVEEPQSFYTVRGEPMRGSYPFGEPMFCNVTITNNSDFDLTVGPNGVLKPDLWFDAQLRGMVQQQLVGITYDRISQVMVLKAKSSISQIVRIDQAGLHDILTTNPTPSIQVFVSALTNPTSIGGRIEAGAAGVRVQFPRIFARTPFPINNEAERSKLVASVDTGNPSEKFNALELLNTLIVMMRNPDAATAAGNDAERMAVVANQFNGVVQRTRTDPQTSVATWAAFLSAKIAQGDEKRRLIANALNSGVWTARLAGLAAAAASREPLDESIPPMIQKLANEDADDLVKRYATAVIEAQKETATTQPATKASK